MKIILGYKYCAFILLLTILVGCQDISKPELSERISIKNISKWKVDTSNESKIALIFFKEFDQSGDLILQKDFSENGTISTQSVYSYDTNLSIEVKSSFTESGDIKEETRCEYVYDNLRRIIKQIKYSNTGSIDQIILFSYDSRGNVVKTTQAYGSSSDKDKDINFDYTYNGTGELVEKVTKNDLGDLSRESISYDSDLRKVTINRYNSLGEFESRTVYFYNSIGNIISEHIFNADYQNTHKFIYEYEFYLNK